MGMITMSPRINPASNPNERGSIDPIKQPAKLNIIPEIIMISFPAHYSFRCA
jgi:hypothetical protein